MKKEKKQCITGLQKQVVKDLFNPDMYLLKKKNFDGELMYKLYKGNMIPLRYIPAKVIDKLPLCSIIKTDRHRRITLNLSKVRQLHGKSWIKNQYKKIRDGK